MNASNPTKSRKRIGCVGSLIPDKEPMFTLAGINRNECLEQYPQYKLLVDTIRTTLYACGRFPQSLKDGDFVKSLLDEGITLATSLLGMSDDDVASGAKSIARQLIHREQKEHRWFEVVDGKRIRKSKIVWRIDHPVKRDGGDRDATDTVVDDPLETASESLTAGSHGIVTTQYKNHVEAEMIAALEAAALDCRILDILGMEDNDWLLNYYGHDRVKSDAERARCGRLMAKVRRELGLDS